MTTLAIVLAVFVGVSLGLLGGGGSILMVPLLAYVAGMDAKQAIATSLLVVGTTSAVGAISHARAGRVQWRTALMFGATAMAGATNHSRDSHARPRIARLGWMSAGLTPRASPASFRNRTWPRPASSQANSQRPPSRAT